MNSLKSGEPLGSSTHNGGWMKSLKKLQRCKMNTKPIVAWRITNANNKPTDKEGFAPMRVSHACGDSEIVDLKLYDWGVGSCQMGKMVHISCYVSRENQWYVIGWSD